MVAELFEILPWSWNDLEIDDRLSFQVSDFNRNLIQDVEFFNQNHPLGEEHFDLAIIPNVNKVWLWALLLKLWSHVADYLLFEPVENRLVVRLLNLLDYFGDFSFFLFIFDLCGG